MWKDKRIRELRLRKSEVGVVIKVFVDHVVEALLMHGKVKMQGLFTLDVRKIKGRRISHPQTKKHMYTKDSYKVGLKPSKRLEEGLKKKRDS